EAKRKLEEKKKLEAKRKLEEKKKLEAKRKLEEKKKLEAKRKLEEKKKLEAKRQLEAKKKLEAKRQLEAKKKQDYDALAAAISKMAASKKNVAPAPTTIPGPAVPTANAVPSRWAVDQWALQVQQMVRSHWRKPTGIKNEDQLSVKVRVRVTPDGFVTQPKIIHSSGSSAYDGSVLRAISNTREPIPYPRNCQRCREPLFTFRSMEQ
ncbi:cell envelope integrity protein TolA, partial [Magnetococcales bacterium HHB-1]